MIRRSALLILVAITLAACAGLPPRLSKPEVVGATVRVVSVALPDIRLAIELEVVNRNAVDIALDSLTARVVLEDQPVAAAALEGPVRLPANASARVPLAARGDAAVALSSLGRALGSGRPLRYEVSGEATLADGTRFAFVRRGETRGARP